MKRDEGKNIFIFLALVIAGALFYFLYDRHKAESKRKNEISKLRNRIHQGFEIDTVNLSSDWGNIYQDVEKSHHEMSSNA